MHDRKHDQNADEARARAQDHAAAPHDRRHDLGADPADHEGERHLSLSARTLAARGDAPDGSEDGTPEDETDAV
jgi:hypothetical protein